MAQEYLKQTTDYVENQYGIGEHPLLAVGRQNFSALDGIKIMPVTTSETLNTGDQVAVSRMKRVKSAATVEAASKGVGTNGVARRDAAKRVEWDTSKMTAVNKRDILIRFSVNQDLDISDKSKPHARMIASQINNTIDFMEEQATAEIFNDTNVKGIGAAGAVTKLAYDGTLTQAQAVIDNLMKGLRKVSLLSDAFKHYTKKSELLTVLHPVLGEAFAKVQGQSYQTGTNTFPNGLGNSFTYMGYEFVISETLNGIDGAAATEVAGAIVMYKGAYINAGISYFMQPINQKDMDETVAGHSYAELSLVLDPARIFKYELTLAGLGLAASAKVND